MAIAPKLQCRNQFLGKILYLNLLVDMASVFRMHGLYPKLAHTCKLHVPHMYTAHHYIANQTEFDEELEFDKLR